MTLDLFFLVKFFLVFNSAVASISQGDISGLKGSLITLHTQLGDIVVQKLGTPNAVKTPIIALPGSNFALHQEWTKICEQLTEHDYYASIIHFKFKFKPNMSDVVINIIHDAIFQNHVMNHNLQKVIIMGKSAGGAIAQLYSEMYATDVMKLILVAPIFNDPRLIRKLSTRNIPILLLWAKDDKIAPYSVNMRKWKNVFESSPVNSDTKTDDLQLVKSALGARKGLTSKFSSFSPSVGGHVILDAYFDPIYSFISGG